MGYYQLQGDFYEAQGDPIFGLGSLIGLAGKGLGRLFKRKGPQLLPPGPGMGSLDRIGRGVGRMIEGHAVITGAAGEIGSTGAVLASRKGIQMGTQALRGFHTSKRTGKLVRNRRMRVTNVKALRRAIRRAEGFSRIAKKVLHFTSPRRVHGRGVFRVRRRKKL